MAETPSNMLPLGTVAPDFKLPDTVSGKEVSLKDLQSEIGVVVMFICNHCPFVIHVQDEISALAQDYKIKGVEFIAISANDIVNYPQDAPDKMRTVAMENGYSFPYLYNESQSVAKAYNAACTPDFFVFNKNLELYYRGQLDGARPGNNTPVTGESLREALDHLVAGQSAPTNQLPSIGCGIKWK